MYRAIGNPWNVPIVVFAIEVQESVFVRRTTVVLQTNGPVPMAQVVPWPKPPAIVRIVVLPPALFPRARPTTQRWSAVARALVQAVLLLSALATVVIQELIVRCVLAQRVLLGLTKPPPPTRHMPAVRNVPIEVCVM